jgi:hypothetical protein
MVELLEETVDDVEKELFNETDDDEREDEVANEEDPVDVEVVRVPLVVVVITLLRLEEEFVTTDVTDVRERARLA